MRSVCFAVKQVLRQPLFCLLLVLCTAVIALAGSLSDSVQMRPAGVCDLSHTAESERITAYLLQNGFVAAEDPETLQEQVQRGALDCGAVLPEDLTVQLQSGDPAGCVRWIQSPSSLLPELYRNHAAAAVFREAAPHLTAPLFEETGVPQEDVLQAYEAMFAKGHVFSFEILSAETGGTPADVRRENLITGAAAILLFLLVFAACGRLWEHSFRHMLGRIGFRKAMTAVLLPGLLVRLLLIAAAGAAGLLLARMPQLLPALGIYVLLLAGLWLLLAALLPRVGQATVLLTVWILASAALCPIYADLSLLSPAVSAVRWLLPPYWLWCTPLQLMPWCFAAWCAGLFLLYMCVSVVEKYRLA